MDKFLVSYKNLLINIKQYSITFKTNRNVTRLETLDKINLYAWVVIVDSIKNMREGSWLSVVLLKFNKNTTKLKKNTTYGTHICSDKHYL